MKVIILNGSPKGENSVTIQSIKYLDMIYKNHEFEYMNIVNDVKKYEKEEAELIRICQKIMDSDIVIWAFPVYHHLVHSEYKRFIELIFEQGLESFFAGKYTGIFSTSIHFYDHTAHNYIHGICDDLGMNTVESLSHHMEDLIKVEKRNELKKFLDSIVYASEEKLIIQRNYKKLTDVRLKYISSIEKAFIETDKRITILTDACSEDENLNNMISKYASFFKGNVRIEDINNLKASGYCLGCCKCARNNICVYHEKDDYRSFMDDVLKNSDVLIFAGKIRDRALSARFKWFFDRSFCYTHIPIYAGKQMGFIISGALSELSNVKQILESYSQMDANLIGFISDECESNEELDGLMRSFAKRTAYYSEKKMTHTLNFLGVSGRNIFRDEIAGSLGGIFYADYKYYKTHGMLEFPKIKDKIQAMVMRYFMSKKRFYKEVEKNMVYHMVSRHKKLLKKVEQEKCL